MFNLQVNASEIGRGIQEDLDMEMLKIGISITSFAISSFNYPEEVQKMAEKAAAQSMIGDVGRFQQVAMGEAIASGKGGGAASDGGSDAAESADAGWSYAAGGRGSSPEFLSRLRN